MVFFYEPKKGERSCHSRSDCSDEVCIRRQESKSRRDNANQSMNPTENHPTELTLGLRLTPPYVFITVYLVQWCRRLKSPFGPLVEGFLDG